MRAQLKWSPGPGVKVLGSTLQDEENWVVSAAAKPVGICPDCGTQSRHRHGWHNRRLKDLPVQGQVVKIKLALNRWQCRHRKCGRR
ncbi:MULTISPECIES: transposase family protein [unclassified Ensifer]|uniref:transposase family protein n=1 Tax=unclassified Ensifer TaxID=2633371 RepID=UPI00300FB3DC